MIISDSSSLILLAKSNILRPFAKNHKLIIPTKVYNETVEKGKEKGREDAYLVEKLTKEDKILVKKAKENEKENIKDLFGITKGENSVIALAVEKNPDLVLMDDEKGIKACKTIGIDFSISADIIVGLFEKGRINKNKAMKALEKLEKYGWFEAKIIRDRKKKILGENQ